MRRPFLLLAPLVLLLASCSGGTQTYSLKIDATDAQRQNELASAAARVVERRLLGLKQDVKPGDVAVEGDILTAKPAKAEIGKELSRQLSEPFEMRIMAESDEASADIRSDKYGAFRETGITEKQFDWVRASATDGGKKGTAVILFTPEGRELLKQVFEQQKGKTIGIFLRGNLMSKRAVTENEAPDVITIDGIPSAEIAAVFADDVNVGLHVVFEPVK